MADKLFEDNFEKVQKKIYNLLETKEWNSPNFAFQIDVTGYGGGIFFIKSYNNKIGLQPFDYRDHTARIWISWYVLFAVLDGRMLFTEAINNDRASIYSKEEYGLRMAVQFFSEITKNEANGSLIDPGFFGDRINIDVSRVFPVVVMATMSSGKSTLINALLGEDILPSRNDACTAKVFSVLDDDTATEKTLYVTRANGGVKVEKENLVEELEWANNDNEVTEILLSGQIKGVHNTDRSTLIIDTPGPNNSRNDAHGQITEQILDKIEGGLLLYIMNATQMGVNDDRQLLDFVRKKIENKKELKILFVMNKVDQLDEEKGELISDFLMQSKIYLENCGFKNPEIIPVSARAANLFKKAVRGEILTRRQTFEFDAMYEKFQSKGLRLGTYAAADLSELQREVKVGANTYTVMELENAIEDTGITWIEKKIQECQILSNSLVPLKVSIN